MLRALQGDDDVGLALGQADEVRQGRMSTEIAG
jgi:hypothetical protein